MKNSATTWPTKPLGKVAKIERTSVTPERIRNGSLYVGLENITREGGFDSVREVVNGELASNKFEFTSSHVLYGKLRPYLSKIARPDFSGICSTDILPILPGKDVDRDYLYHFLRQPEMVQYATTRSTGANLPRLSPKQLAEFPVPLPKFEEQKRIAAILDKADAIRRKRQEVIQELKDLRLAVFHGFFREELTLRNMTECLTDVAEVVSGVAKGRKLNGSDTREVPYLRVANVQSGYLDLSEIKTIPAKETEINAYSLRVGDIVMTEGGDHDKLGRGALWERDILNCIHQNHIFRVRLNQEKLLPRFFVYFLQSSIAKQYFLRCAKKTTNLASINMTQLRALPVPHVSLLRQEVFEEIVASIDACLERQALFVAEAEDLSSSLSQRAFKGEL